MQLKNYTGCFGIAPRFANAPIHCDGGGERSGRLRIQGWLTDQVHPILQTVFCLKKKKAAQKCGFGGDYRTRTCDLLRVKQAL